MDQINEELPYLNGISSSPQSQAWYHYLVLLTAPLLSQSLTEVHINHSESPNWKYASSHESFWRRSFLDFRGYHYAVDSMWVDSDGEKKNGSNSLDQLTTRSLNLKLKFWICNQKNMGFRLILKKYTTSGWALGDENVIGIRAFNGISPSPTYRTFNFSITCTYKSGGAVFWTFAAIIMLLIVCEWIVMEKKNGSNSTHYLTIMDQLATRSGPYEDE